MSNPIPPCCGIIVIDNDKTILVCTERDNYSFPFQFLLFYKIIKRNDPINKFFNLFI
jgi:hypothetical protein